MSKTSAHSLSRKEYLKLKEVDQLYKMINKYNLRPEAYKRLLEIYIKFKKEKS